MRLHRALAAGLLSAGAWAGPAAAHSFATGADIYTSFVEGAAVAFESPPLILGLVSLGLLVGLWQRDGMVKVWPFFGLGLLLGMAVAPWVSGAAPAGLGVGVVCAVLAALAPRMAGQAFMALAGLTGFVAGLVALDGHGFAELPVQIYLGIILGINLVVTMPAAAAAQTLETWPQEWLRIGWRVAASWSAAIGVMLLAFALR